MAMRSHRENPPGPLRRVVHAAIAAPWLLSLLWPMLLVVLGAIAWQRYGAMRVAREFVGVSADQITVTRRPAHVRDDVTNAVFRDFPMDRLSLLEPAATAKIASAYSVQPWVRDVISVRKLPGGKVDVAVRYRDVAAMVKVFKPVGRGISPDRPRVPHFFPVDDEGIVLPAADFSSAETDDYIHIDVPGVYSTSAVGTPFGHAVVESAARLAGVLSPHRDELHIDRIVPLPDRRRRGPPQFEVHFMGGRRPFHWGSAPGRERDGEPDVRTKFERLVASSS